MRSFLERLGRAQIDTLLSKGALIRYCDKELIHSRGDDKVGVSIVATGAAYTGVYGEDGEFLLTAILGPGQIFGEFTLFAGLPRTHDISAIGPTEIYQIPGKAFEHLCDQDSGYLRALLSLSLERLHVMLEVADALRRLPLPVRLARMIQLFSEHGPNPQHLNFRQSDLAATLGVTRPSLVRALRKIEGLNLIETGYGYIRIPHPDRLKTWVANHSKATVGG